MPPVSLQKKYSFGIPKGEALWWGAGDLPAETEAPRFSLSSPWRANKIMYLLSIEDQYKFFHNSDQTELSSSSAASGERLPVCFMLSNTIESR